MTRGYATHSRIPILVDVPGEKTQRCYGHPEQTPLALGAELQDVLNDITVAGATFRLSGQTFDMGTNRLTVPNSRPTIIGTTGTVLRSAAPWTPADGGCFELLGSFTGRHLRFECYCPLNIQAVCLGCSRSLPPYAATGSVIDLEDVQVAGTSQGLYFWESVQIVFRGRRVTVDAGKWAFVAGSSAGANSQTIHLADSTINCDSALSTYTLGNADIGDPSGTGPHAYAFVCRGGYAQLKGCTLNAKATGGKTARAIYVEGDQSATVDALRCDLRTSQEQPSPSDVECKAGAVNLFGCSGTDKAFGILNPMGNVVVK